MILPQESVLDTELTKTKSTRAKGKEIPSKKRHRKLKSQSKENPKGNPEGKRGKSTKSDKKRWKGSKKVVSTGKTGEKNTSTCGRKNTEKSGSKGKKNGDKNGGKAKVGQK